MQSTEHQKLSKRKRETNIQFVTRLMTFGGHGPVDQIFIIEAIRFYLEHTIANCPDEDDGKAFISNKLWLKIAKDLNVLFEEKYGKKEEVINPKI